MADYGGLISRLRDAVKVSDALAVFLSNGGGSATATLLGEAADAIEEMTRRCEQIRYMLTPAWIPAAERLPNKYADVLVFLRSLDGKASGYSVDYLKLSGNWHKAENTWKYSVTHWMPLPEPPKEENDEA